MKPQIGFSHEQPAIAPSGPMTGFEIVYRVGRKTYTERRLGWNVEDTRFRVQRDTECDFAPRVVTIISITEIGYDAAINGPAK